MMKDLELVINELIEFILLNHVESIPEYYYDVFLNYLGVTYLGSKNSDIDVVINSLLDDHSGIYSPIGRKEKMSLSDVALIDCYASAIYAYDDIHFETTSHPTGPVMSALLAIARTQSISLKKILTALCIGMEVECRMGVLLFSNNNTYKGYYTTGIIGGFGVVAALSYVLEFNKEQISNALGLVSCYASGNRGNHGSMAGSFIPAIACKNGLDVCNLVKHGMTCSINALIGTNGLVNQITTKPNVNEARQGLGEIYISMNTSCKPYPYGFISFASIALLKQLSISEMFNSIEVEVSSCVYELGCKKELNNKYDAIVSLPYILSRVIVVPDNTYCPITDDIVSEEITKMMEKISIIENQTLNDDEVYMTINKKRHHLKDAPGSINNPMSHNDILNKFKVITNIQTSNQIIYKIYNEDINDIYAFIKEYMS